jgi:hypothetical protein
VPLPPFGASGSVGTGAVSVLASRCGSVSVGSGAAATVFESFPGKGLSSSDVAVQAAAPPPASTATVPPAAISSLAEERMRPG